MRHFSAWTRPAPFAIWVASICEFFFSSRRRHTRCLSDWSSDVCSSDLGQSRIFVVQKHDAVDLQPKVIMQPTGVMLLHDKNPALPPTVDAPRGLRRRRKFSLPAVLPK